METFSLYDEAQMTQWDAFVQSHPNGTPYHLSSWMRTVQESYGFEPLLYADKEEGGEMRGVFPFFLVKTPLTRGRLVSLPFSDYGGPLFKTPVGEAEALDFIEERHKGSVKNVEIRSPLQSSNGFTSTSYYKRHVLDLTMDYPKLLKLIDKRTIQYSIRKAERIGIEIREESTLSGMNEFYRLNMLTRKKHGVPSQPKKFFDNLVKNVFAKEEGFLLLATYRSNVIGTSLFLRSNGTIHYKYNASDPGHLKTASPNHALTWHAIKQGHETGCHLFDFGRTAPDNEGLMRYKKMWGTKVIDLQYNYYPKMTGASSTQQSNLGYRIATNIWRSLPDIFVEKLGPLLYKYMA